MNDKLKCDTYGNIDLPYVGPGLDYSSWNGSLLVGKSGALFGVRIGFLQDDKYITGNDFFELVNQVGSRASDSTYAKITASPVTISWGKTQNDSIFGGVQSSQSNTLIVLEVYSPYEYPGVFRFENETVILGVSPGVHTTQGDTLITGGLAIVQGRTKSILEIQKEKESLTVQFFKKPVIYGTCENVRDINVNLFDRIEQLNENKMAYAIFRLEENELFTFIASLNLSKKHHEEKYTHEWIKDSLKEAEVNYNYKKVYGTGILGRVAETITSELFWIMIYHPYVKRTWITLGRHWIENYPWNIWGWDECLAGIIASLESEEVARNCILTAYQDMRLGPYATWKVYTKFHDKKLLECCYPYFRDYYSDADLVRGGMVFLNGEKQDANFEVGKGMDDTLMRDVEGLEMYSLDGSCQKAWNLEIMAKMGIILGDLEYVEKFTRYYNELKDSINTVLWNEDEGIYLNRYIETGEWNYVESPTCFYPLLAGVPSDEQVCKLISHLLNPEEFWGDYIIPTLNKNHPAYGLPSPSEYNKGWSDHPDYGLPSPSGYKKGWSAYCYWRGNIWPPTNYLVYQGLKRYEIDDIAYEFAKKSTTMWQKTWEKYNWACENYHPETGERSEMSYKHYNWSMLLPLMGIEEMLDVEAWNDVNGIRFGNIGINELNTLHNVRVNKNIYSLLVNKDFLLFSCNGENCVEVQGTAVIRNFIFKYQGVELEINCNESIILKLYIPSSENSTKTIINAGKWKVSYFCGALTLTKK